MFKLLRNIKFGTLCKVKGVHECRTYASLSGSEKQPLVLVEKDMNITLIGINREHTRNSIDAQTAVELTAAIRAFEADDSSPVGVLYGVGGGSFCAGYDLQDLEQQLSGGSLDFLLRHEGAVGPTRRHVRKPLIAAINGYCVANGLELALMCDLRIMEETAVLAFFNRRIGVPLSDGGTVRLKAAVGLARALEIMSTGRRVPAAEALRIGLINRLVATGTALGQAVHLAFCISKFSAQPLLQDRNALLENTYIRDSFRAATQREIMQMSDEVLQNMRASVQSFKGSDVKSTRTDGWNIKDKEHPDWEKTEIAHEERAAKKKL